MGEGGGGGGGVEGGVAVWEGVSVRLELLSLVEVGPISLDVPGVKSSAAISVTTTGDSFTLGGREGADEVMLDEGEEDETSGSTRRLDDGGFPRPKVRALGDVAAVGLKMAEDHSGVDKEDDGVDDDENREGEGEMEEEEEGEGKEEEGEEMEELGSGKEEEEMEE